MTIGATLPVMRSSDPGGCWGEQLRVRLDVTTGIVCIGHDCKDRQDDGDCNEVQVKVAVEPGSSLLTALEVGVAGERQCAPELRLLQTWGRNEQTESREHSFTASLRLICGFGFAHIRHINPRLWMGHLSHATVACLLTDM